MLGETTNQFSPALAALSTSGRAKSNFLSVVVRKIHLPPNDKYNFGYAKYEPFMTAVDAISQ